MSARRQDKGGLSVGTLVIAAMASAAAAIVVREVWGPGTILGAAMTPVVIAVVSEVLRRPHERLVESAPVVLPRGGRLARDSHDLEAPPTVVEPAPDEREDERASWLRRRWKIVATTAALAFAIAVGALTFTELVAGGSAAGGGHRTTVFGGQTAPADEAERDQEEQQQQPSAPQPSATATPAAPEREDERSAQPAPDTGATPTPTPTGTPSATPSPAQATPSPAE